MKKNLWAMLILVIAIALTGCAGPTNESHMISQSPLADPTQSPNVVVTTPKESTLPPSPSATSTPSADGIDVDLTTLSSTMVYAEVFNIMMDPDAYLGKTIKVRGPYYASFYEQTEQYYHFVIISDATACCAEGLEFFRVGEYSYPQDYPADETEVEIVGIFEEYVEDDYTYYHIITESFQVL